MNSPALTDASALPTLAEAIIGATTPGSYFYLDLLAISYRGGDGRIFVFDERAGGLQLVRASADASKR